MSKDNKAKDKGKAKVSFRAMIIAMIIALLGFLGFGGLELGNGDGADIDTGDKTGIVSDVDDAKDGADDAKDGTENASDDSELNAYLIYIREDKIFIPSEENEDGFKEVTLAFIEEQLSALESNKSVIIYDDGAINKTYADVVALVDNKELRKIEEKASN